MTLGLLKYHLWFTELAFGSISFSDVLFTRLFFFMNESQYHCSKLKKKIIVYIYSIYTAFLSFLTEFHKYSFCRMYFARIRGTRNEFRNCQHKAWCLSSLGSSALSQSIAIYRHSRLSNFRPVCLILRSKSFRHWLWLIVRFSEYLAHGWCSINVK